MNGYVGFFKGRRAETEAETTFQAQKQLAAIFKAKRQSDVTVMLAEKNGEQVVHAPMF
ncbi:hypothetical protein G3A43_07510 [Paraburkholderia aspalathi]|nr:hypothetical protein [Paraburkholderia aspalathi]MBK3780101.1 hypothetical protein [Paraburkholderia aspalathi]